jgi:NAD-dependent SIR2 family protein deacetylase
MIPECPHCGEELHEHEIFYGECYSCQDLTAQEQEDLRSQREEAEA